MPDSSERPRGERALVALDRLVLDVFFRRLEVEGLERVPRQGPLIVVANHTNSLVDPMLVLGILPRMPRFLAKSTLFDKTLLRPFLHWARVIPVYRRQDAGADVGRNVETFAACRRVLAAGGVICLFPEGRSHSEPALAPLKTGAARIALEAEAEHGPLGVTLLPVGLQFDARERFRSRALAEIGAPFPALAAAGPAAPRPGGGVTAAPPEAVHRLTSAIDDALQAVTVNFDTWEEARLVRRAAEIYTRPALELPQRDRLATSAAVVRTFASGYRQLRERHPQRVARVAEAVRVYDRLLQTAGLSDRHVAATYQPLPVTRFLRRSLGTLLLRLPAAAVGTLLNAIPYQLVSLLGPRLAPKPDALATWKIFPALALYPLTWIAEAVAAGWWAGGGGAGWLAGLAVLVLAPLSGRVAIPFHDRRSQLVHEVRVFLELRTRGRFARELRAERLDVRRRVEELVALYQAETDEAGDGDASG